MTRSSLVLFAALGVLSCGEGETTQHTVPTQTAEAAKIPPPPDAAGAAALISSSAEFSEFEFTNAGYSLPLRVSAMNAPARAVANELAASGWISMKSDQVVLSSKAESDRRWLVRPNGVVDIVPLAKKEFVAIAALERQTDGAVAATFSWRWLPNDIGQVFHRSVLKDRFAGERRGVATLMWDGANWIVLRITTLA